VQSDVNCRKRVLTGGEVGVLRMVVRASGSPRYKGSMPDVSTTAYLYTVTVEASSQGNQDTTLSR
jgi:hypothetical protein